MEFVKSQSCSGIQRSDVLYAVESDLYGISNAKRGKTHMNDELKQQEKVQKTTDKHLQKGQHFYLNLKHSTT